MIFLIITCYNFNGDNMKLFIYIIFIICLLVGLFFLNRKIKLKYNDFSVNNFRLYIECVLINLASLLFGKNYFSFSIYLVAVIMIYLVYLTKGFKEINDEDERVSKSAKYFVTHLVFIILINIPIYFISGLKIIGFTCLSAFFLLVIFALETLICVKKENTYKIMSQDEISKLFPNYDINKLYIALFNTLVFIKNNYMNNNTDLCKDYLGETLFNEYKAKENENVSKKQKEVFEEFLYSSGNLVAYDSTTNKFTVELTYSFKNHVADIETGRVLSGTPQFPKRNTYVIEMIYKEKVIIVSEKLHKSI